MLFLSWKSCCSCHFRRFLRSLGLNFKLQVPSFVFPLSSFKFMFQVSRFLPSLYFGVRGFFPGVHTKGEIYSEEPLGCIKLYQQLYMVILKYYHNATFFIHLFTAISVIGKRSNEASFVSIFYFLRRFFSFSWLI